MGYRNVRLSAADLAEIEEGLMRLSRAPSVVASADGLARSAGLRKLADRMAIEKGCAQRNALDPAEQVLQWFLEQGPDAQEGAGLAALGAVWVRKVGG